MTDNQTRSWGLRAQSSTSKIPSRCIVEAISASALMSRNQGRTQLQSGHARRHMEDSMRSEFSKTAAGYVLAVAWVAGTVSTQTAVPAAQAAPHSSAVASPTYVSLRMEITVNRPAAEVWKQFGKYCSVAEWMQTACTITSGKDGELGAVRT